MSIFHRLPKRLSGFLRRVVLQKWPWVISWQDAASLFLLLLRRIWGRARRFFLCLRNIAPFCSWWVPTASLFLFPITSQLGYVFSYDPRLSSSTMGGTSGRLSKDSAPTVLFAKPLQLSCPRCYHFKHHFDKIQIFGRQRHLQRRADTPHDTQNPTQQ